MPRSSVEIKYRIMAALTNEMIWTKTFLAVMGIFLDKPIRLFCNNQTTLHMAKNPMFHKRTKHIKINCHFVRERLFSGDYIIGHKVSSGRNFHRGTWKVAVSISTRQGGHD